MTRPTGDEFQELAASIDKLSGQVAGLIAYVAAIPGAEEVDPKSLKQTVVFLAPGRIARPTDTALAPFDVAVRTTEQIAEMARVVAATRAAGGRR